MKLSMLASVSVFALMLSATPAHAASSRQQCYSFTLLGQHFDCGHDRSTDRQASAPRPEPPQSDDDDSDDDDDDTGGDGDGDGDGDHDCKDGGGKGGNY